MSKGCVGVSAFTSLTSARIIKELWMNLEGQKGNQHTATNSKGRRAVPILNLALQDFHLGLERAWPLSASPVLVLPHLCVGQQACIRHVVHSLQVQCGTLQYQFQVNRI